MEAALQRDIQVPMFSPVLLHGNGVDAQLSWGTLSSYIKGVSAERCAERELESKGYRVLGKRVKNRYGEIDILAQKDADLVAVEVKQRRTLDSARSCISAKQRRRISDAILCFISNSEEHFESYRIDVVCLDSIGRFEHIENAFPIEGSVEC
ncbi:MAG: YraN family protein [Holosporales bacterium]|jgi:putative endonuclease|nr:YraN family protein [Holosporales bacterium]